MPPLPPVTQALLLINVAIFFLDELLGRSLTAWFALFPIGDRNFLPWQVVTYGFLHGNFMHLLFNGIGIWMFGSDVELDLGRRRYLVLYFGSILGGALLHMLMTPLIDPSSRAPILGASGAVFGLLTAFAMRNPNRTILLLIPPIPMKARTMAIVYGALEVWALLPAFVPGVSFLNQLMGNIAHLAHLGGMLVSFLTIRYWQGRPPFRRRR